MGNLKHRLSSNCTDFIRAAGGPHIGALLKSAGCFDPPTLDVLWSEDDECWEAWFEAYRSVLSLEEALCRRSHHRYSVPTERTFCTLKALTEYMSDLLVQSFVLKTPKYPATVVHVGLANLTVGLLAESDLDRCILLEFMVELAISLGESPVLIRALEGMAKSEPSKEVVLEVITAHATGPLGRLTVVEHGEVVV
jgi:hypothetical protein